jgi:hypothetical protein
MNQAPLFPLADGCHMLNVIGLFPERPILIIARLQNGTMPVPA